MGCSVAIEKLPPEWHQVNFLGFAIFPTLSHVAVEKMNLLSQITCGWHTNHALELKIFTLTIGLKLRLHLKVFGIGTRQ
ncbi:hypothetical protein CK203_087942 [Vitis vinifera]|uniref:Uncharacterized protein n=1 Tax=Vitis vinifera TaxID=29760 RepID=A0A438D7Z7_VITVI|nr:hypothetical protein CK203_087942 [Vitis vinifera]